MRDDTNDTTSSKDPGPGDGTLDPPIATIQAKCFVKLDYRDIGEFLALLRELPQVTSYAVTTGEFSGIISLEVSDMDELYDFFARFDAVEGVVATNTHVVLKRFDFPRA